MSTAQKLPPSTPVISCALSQLTYREQFEYARRLLARQELLLRGSDLDNSTHKRPQADHSQVCVTTAGDADITDDETAQQYQRQGTPNKSNSHPKFQTPAKPTLSSPRFHTTPAQIPEDSNSEVIVIPQENVEEVQHFNKFSDSLVQRVRHQRQLQADQQHSAHPRGLLGTKGTPLSPISPSNRSKDQQPSSIPHLQNTTETVTITIRPNLPSKVRILLNWLITVSTIPESDFAPYEPLCSRLFEDVFHPNSTRKPFSSQSQSQSTKNNPQPLQSQMIRALVKQNDVSAKEWEQEEVEELLQFNNINDATLQLNTTPHQSFDSPGPTSSSILIVPAATGNQQPTMGTITDMNQKYQINAITSQKPTSVIKISSNLSDVGFHPRSHTEPNGLRQTPVGEVFEDDIDDLDHMFDDIEKQPTPVPKAQHFSPQRYTQTRLNTLNDTPLPTIDSRGTSTSSQQFDSQVFHQNSSFSRKLLLQAPETGKKGAVYQLLAKAPSKKQEMLDANNRFVGDDLDILDSVISSQPASSQIKSDQQGSITITGDTIINASQNRMGRQIPFAPLTTPLSAIKKATGGRMVEYIEELDDFDFEGDDGDEGDQAGSRVSSINLDTNNSSVSSTHEPILISPSHHRTKQQSTAKPITERSPQLFTSVSLQQLNGDAQPIPKTPTKHIVHQDVQINTSLESLDPNDSFFANSPSSHEARKSNSPDAIEYSSNASSGIFVSSSTKPSTTVSPALKGNTTQPAPATSSKPVGSVPSGVQFVDGRWVRDPKSKHDQDQDDDDDSDDPFGSDTDDADVLDDIPDFDTPGYLQSNEVDLAAAKPPIPLIFTEEEVLLDSILDTFSGIEDSGDNAGHSRKSGSNPMGIERRRNLGLDDVEGSRLIDALPDDLDQSNFLPSKDGRSAAAIILDQDDQAFLDDLPDDEHQPYPSKPYSERLNDPKHFLTTTHSQPHSVPHKSPIVLAMSNPLLPTTHPNTNQHAPYLPQISVGIRSTVLAPIQDRGIVVSTALDEGLDDFLQHEGTFSPRNINRGTESYADDLAAASISLDTPLNNNTPGRLVFAHQPSTSSSEFGSQGSSFQQQAASEGSFHKSNGASFLSPFQKPLAQPTNSGPHFIQSLILDIGAPATKKGPTHTHVSKASFRAQSAQSPAALALMDDFDDFDDDEEEEAEKARLLLLKTKGPKGQAQNTTNSSGPANLIQDNHAKKTLHELELPQFLLDTLLQTEQCNASYFPTAPPITNPLPKRRGRSASRARGTTPAQD